MQSTHIELKTIATATKAAVIDVVFIHGLTGKIEKSWKGDAGSWPEWLGTDHPDINVMLCGYPSDFFNEVLVPGKANTNFHEKAKSILDHLCNYGVGKRPIVFICHSLAGVLLQEILRLSESGVNQNWCPLATNTKGIIFLGVPFGGSSVAAPNFLPLSKLLKALNAESHYLPALNEWFRGFADQSKCSIRPYAEGKPTNGMMIVDAKSANPCVANGPIITTDEDHVSIAKPTSRGHPVYLGTSTMIDQIKGILPKTSGTIFQLENELLEEKFKGYSRKIDRPSLAEKLRMGGRDYLIEIGVRKKQDFAKRLYRSGLTESSKLLYTKVCDEVEVKFNRHILHLIHAGENTDKINKAIQSDVVNPILEKFKEENESILESTIDEAIYYLTGTCHIKWHANA